MKLLKSVWFYVVFTFTICAATIFALIQQVGGLKRKIRVTEAERELEKTLGSLEEKKNEADAKEAQFRDADSKLNALLNGKSGE